MAAEKFTGLDYLNVFMEIFRIATANVGVGAGQYPLLEMTLQPSIQPSQTVERKVVTPFVARRQVCRSLNGVRSYINARHQSRSAYPRQMLFTNDQAEGRVV